jgi:hypothetical protein
MNHRGKNYAARGKIHILISLGIYVNFREMDGQQQLEWEWVLWKNGI